MYVGELGEIEAGDARMLIVSTCHIARKYCTVSQMLEEEKTEEHRWRLKRKQHFLYISVSLSHRLHILVIEL